MRANGSTAGKTMAMFCVFLVSTLTLMLEFVQTRIFSVIYWNHLVYFIVTISLLGIAISGTILSVSSRIKALPKKTFYIICLAGFSISALAGLYIAVSFPIDLGSFWNTPVYSIVALLLSYSAAMIPYIFFGLLIAGTFLYYPEQVGTTYFVNLGGSALGCVAYVFLITPLGAMGMVLSIFVVGVLPVILYIGGKRKVTGVILIICTAAVAVLGWNLIDIVPEKNKQYWLMFDDRNVEFSQWNAISRIDVVSEAGDEQFKRILIDGDAQTPLVNSDEVGIDTRLREVVYMLKGGRAGERVLVIGSGGGLDVAVALWFGAGEVDAVDINPTTVDLVSNRYSEFIGGLFERDNVRLHLEDGRSFVRRSKRRHDVITLFAVDTLGALSTGAYVLSENYLYTVEAFKDYWRDLEDDGMIQIARWYFPEFPRETLRIFTTAYEAMAYSGVKEPGRHLLIVTDARDRFFADIIISKKPFTDERLASVGGWLAMNNLKVVYDPTKDLGSTAFDRFVRYAGGGKKAEFYKDYVFNVKPVTDNNPFFFQYGRWSHVFKAYPMAENVFESIVGKWPFLTLLALIAQTVVMVVFLVWIPVLRLKRDATRPGGGRIYVIAYFALLGTAFMFIEISMIQKLVLVLGHPIYSMAVTIPTILVMAGLGSLYTDYTRMKRSTMVVAAILALAVLMFGWSFMGTVISEAVLASSLTIRILASIMLLLPMGFLMGIPFPLGMRGISSTQEMVPIAWATNGGMSVIGSVVAIVLAMVTGFPYVASIAAVLYLLALLCYFPMVRGVDK